MTFLSQRPGGRLVRPPTPQLPSSFSCNGGLSFPAKNRVCPVRLHARTYLIIRSALLNLHRAYFAQALQERPTDLARHRYIPSVIAIYRSAWRLIEGLRWAWRNVPQPLSRIGLAWSQALSAAVSLSRCHIGWHWYSNTHGRSAGGDVFARDSSTYIKHDAVCASRAGYTAAAFPRCLAEFPVSGQPFGECPYVTP